jgi:hypothetical protein
MGQVSGDTSRRLAGTSRRQGAKTLGSAKPPVVKTTRQTLHLDERTVKRLGVHCSLVGRDRSAVANEILAAWLSRFGQGRRIFEAEDQPRDHAGDVDRDRRDEGLQISPDDQVDAA